MAVQILCEGPTCNGGVSASDAESRIVAGLPSSTGDLREEANKYARSTVSKRLTLHPHKQAGVDGRGHYLYVCQDCGHTRFYGNTVSHYSFGSER